ncbi:MAG: Fic family protein, partial [Elusimicrobiota bacterium]|nr:Fic family protein [Elusimicrobiota bacterium]
MRNDYKYLDYDYKYTDSKTGILRNLANISNIDDLTFFESVAVTKRTNELVSNPIKIKNSQSLLDIHKYLFQDVYDWAGKKRTVEISKGANPFLPTSRFDTGFSYVDNLIEEYRQINISNKEQIAHKLAEILDAVNYLHPFREGNGRTQREFIRLLALEKNINLNLNPPDNDEIYQKYMTG